jgi:hypothetical protein
MATPRVATGNHDAVHAVDDLVDIGQRGMRLDLGDQGERASMTLDHAPRVEDIRGRPDERQRHVVDLVAEAEGQVVAVLVRERRRRDRAGREVDAFARPQRAARDHLATDILLSDANDFQLHIAIAQEQGVAGLDIYREVRVVDGDLLPGAEDLPRGQGERRAGFQRDRSRCYFTDPDLQPGEILKYGNWTTESGGDTTNSRDDLEVLGLRAMREIQPRDVHPGPNQSL